MAVAFTTLASTCLYVSWSWLLQVVLRDVVALC